MSGKCIWKIRYQIDCFLVQSNKTGSEKQQRDLRRNGINNGCPKGDTFSPVLSVSTWEPVKMMLAMISTVDGIEF